MQLGTGNIKTIMINKLEAIKIGKAFVAGAMAEEENCNEPCVTYGINGALSNGLQNLWYDVFSNKVKSYFNHDKEKFYDEVWPLS